MMLADLIVIYLGGWVVAAAGLWTATMHFTDLRAPAAHPLGMSIAAGMAWPLLLLGAVEFSSMAVCHKVREKTTSHTEVFA